MEGAPSGGTPEQPQQPPRVEVEMELRVPEGKTPIGFTLVEGLGVFTTAEGLAAATGQSPETDEQNGKSN